MREYDYRALVECKNALDDILRTLSLDWWVEQFAKDESPSGLSSGVTAMIHNHELRGRVAAVLERGRLALNAVNASPRGEAK